MNDLQISEALSLPIDAAAARFVALGKSGSGKTNAGVVFAEELLAHGVTTAILDVLGNMHGLRAAGIGPGLPIAILGGRNGDVPLRADRGAVVADLIASGVSAVIDLSEFTREDAQAFAADFFARLVPAVDRSRRNVHVIVEEAETFAPQTLTSKAQGAARTATTVFARVARNVGIGWTFSTQRPQLLAKDVIDSSTAFIAMRMTGDLAQAAIGAEVRSRVGKTLERSIIEDLPKLSRGEAWLVPDPDWLGDDRDAEPVKFQFRWRHTFDSARPPRVGERREEPKQIADVDLDGLRAAMADDEHDDVYDRSQAGTNGELEPLRARISELEGEVRFGNVQLDVLREIIKKQEAALHRVRALADGALLGLAAESEAENAEVAPVAPEQGAVQDDGEDRRTADLTSYELPRRTRATSGPARPAEASPSSVKAGARRMLESLARCGGMLSKSQLATLAQINRRSGTFTDYLSILRSKGYIVDDVHTVTITPNGAAAIGQRVRKDYPKAAELVKIFAPRLKGGSRRMLDILVRAHPGQVSKHALAEEAQVSRRSGTFTDYLSILRSNGLIEDNAHHAWASPTLFLGKP